MIRTGGEVGRNEVSGGGDWWQEGEWFKSFAFKSELLISVVCIDRDMKGHNITGCCFVPQNVILVGFGNYKWLSLVYFSHSYCSKVQTRNISWHTDNFSHCLISLSYDWSTDLPFQVLWSRTNISCVNTHKPSLLLTKTSRAHILKKPLKKSFEKLLWIIWRMKSSFIMKMVFIIDKYIYIILNKACSIVFFSIMKLNRWIF